MAGADVRDAATSRGKDHCLGYAGGGGSYGIEAEGN
jgi:hypothetical protein